MVAPATFDRKATPQAEDGDALFYGVNNRLSPEKLPPGWLAAAENCRMRNGKIAPRRGVSKPGWLNGTAAGVNSGIFPFGQLYGSGVFKDPNSIEYTLLAADGVIYRTRPHNVVFAMALPTGVKILSRCSFAQAFNKVYCFRGRYLQPLVLSDIDIGFEDLLPRWDSGATYAASDEVAYGPFQDVTSITNDGGGTATVVTAAPHGYVTGADITVTGATPSENNGRFNITVEDEVTFTYQCPAAAGTATGTIKCSNMAYYWSAGGGGGNPVAGDSPDSAPTKWTQIYNVLPNADDALYINNRLLVPTAYTPGASTYDSTSSYTKKDFIVATDIGDDVHFDFVNNFRINQGSDDEIVCLVKYGPDTAIVVKGKSWGVLSNIGIDLSNLTLDMKGESYGGCALRSAIVAGKDVLFPSVKRGVVSIQQNQLGQLRSVDIPFSNDIPDLIDRINWNYADRIRMAWWDDKLYVGVPLDDGAKTLGASLVPNGATFGGGYYYLVSVTPGQTYYFQNGDYGMNNGSPTIFTESNTFIAASSVVAIYSSPLGIGSFDTINSAIYPITRGANNAMLVYDYRAGENGAWQGVDTGDAISPMEFFKATYGGVERLFFIGNDGYVNMVEAVDTGDQVYSASTATALALGEIEMTADSRGYRFETESPKKFKLAQLVLGVNNARFSVDVLTGAANTDTQVITDKTFSRTQYLRPFDRAAYVDGNVNGDFAEPGRGDYSVSAPVYLTGGVAPDIFQEATARVPVMPVNHRYAQVRLTNTRGRCQVKSITPIAAEGQRRTGTFI